MRFSDPLYLLLLAPAVLGLALSYRHVHGMAKIRKRISIAIRFLLLSLVILALAGPESRSPNVGVCTIFLLDRSDSVSEADRSAAERFVDSAMRSLGPDDAAGVVAFGRNVVIDAAPGGRRPLGRVLSAIDGSASDLAGALRLATAAFPEGKARRIVLLSDGNETAGDAIEAAQVASTDDVQIDHVPLGLAERRAEVSIVELQVPDEVRATQPFDLRVIIDSERSQAGTLVLDRNGVVAKRVPVQLSSGRSAIVVSDRVLQPGFHRYRATLVAPSDHDVRNNVGAGFVSVRGKPKLLVMQESPEQSPLAAALRAQGLEVDLAGPAGMPARAEDIQQYDAVIFNDINASSLSERQMKLVQSAVRDTGVGFAMIGGENSFLPGGYYATPIADALAVDLDIRQRKTFPSTSILIVMDCSGSMSALEDGVVKLRLAAKAAEETIKLMSPMDRVGVAGSTDGIEFVVPMQKLTDKQAAISRLRKIDITGGGIYVRPSIEQSERVLRAEPSKVRHLILLADGADSTDWEGVFARAAGMRAQKITISVVAIGDGKDVPDLKRLAAIGGGRFYLANKASQLPAIFSQDTAVMSRSAIEEGVFLPKLTAGEEILKGIGGVPALYAYCLADTRPLSRVGMRTHKDDPLLATWQYGLGSSLAFTSDAQPRWAAQWVGWEGFAAFWAQAARSISRRATLNDYQVSVRPQGGRGLIELKAFDRLGNPLAANSAQIRVSTPGGGTRELTLAQEAPGVYSGSFEIGELGTYMVTVAEPAGDGVRVSASGFSIPYPPEYRSYRANRPLLQRVSEVSGGRELATPSESLRPVERPGVAIRERWPLALSLAAFLLPLDVAVRRLALPLAEIWAAVWGWVGGRRRRHAPPAAEVVDRLQQAKRRAQRTPVAPESPPASGPPPPPAESPRPAATASGGGVSASSRLLDAKRKRKEEE